MIALILTLCVIDQPAMCHQERLLPPAGVSLPGCMVAAQPAIARLLAQEPGYVLREWHCVDTEKEKIGT